MLSEKGGGGLNFIIHYSLILIYAPPGTYCTCVLRIHAKNNNSDHFDV